MDFLGAHLLMWVNCKEVNAMIEKRILCHERVRRIAGGFAFITDFREAFVDNKTAPI